MKYAFISLLFLNLGFKVSAQQTKSKPLPLPLYISMMDSTTSIDVVFMQGQGGSISVDGKNVHVFNNFFENMTVPKTSTPLAGTIMWEIHGQEFLSGSFYLGDTTGYVVIKKDGKEYVNQISDQGNTFFKNQIKK
jgi:hypothetical protein